MKPSSHARQAWELLLELFLVERGRVPAIAAEFDLSAMQCQVLRLLAPDRPAPMGRLAQTLACDASNITGIVDRLEARGLLERRHDAHDRRLKVLGVTGHGADVRARVLERLAEPPVALARLRPDDLDQLCAILKRALGGSGDAACASRTTRGAERAPGDAAHGAAPGPAKTAKGRRR